MIEATIAAAFVDRHAKLRSSGASWLPELRQVRVAHHIEPFDSRKPLDVCCGRDGWVRFRSAAMWPDGRQSALRWTSTLTPDDLKRVNEPLQAEWIDGYSSFRLVSSISKPGDMSLIIVEELDASASRGMLVARQDTVLLADPRLGFKTRKLEYAVYWGVGDDGAATRVGDSFRGFKDG